MTKEQATQFLLQVLGNIPATKQQHDQFILAIQTLLKENTNGN